MNKTQSQPNWNLAYLHYAMEYIREHHPKVYVECGDTDEFRADRLKELEQPAQQQEWVERERAVGYREGHQNALKQMAAQQHEPSLQDQLDDALDSLAFYKRRVQALQQWQSKMRDPERTIVCDIIANGCTLEPAGDRYKQPAQQQEPVAWISPEYFTAYSKQGFQVTTHEIVPGLIPLYTSPQPSKPWVGLTDEDHAEVKDVMLHVGVGAGVAWIENKLREKNA